MGKDGMRCRVLALLIFGGWAPARVGAVPVELEAVSATAPPAPGYSLDAAVDGQVQEGQGWQLSAESAGGDQAVVFLPKTPVTANLLLLQLFFPGPDPDGYFGRFGVDVTTDAVPALEGRWMPLILETVSELNPSVPLAAVPVMTLENRQTPFSLEVRARVPFDGVTGFRLRLFATEPQAGPLQPEQIPARMAPSLGRGRGGGFLLGEFRIETDDPQTSNLARGRQVYCSRTVEPGFPSRNLTDGFLATSCQPELNRNHPDAFFQIDLGQTRALDHIVVRRRIGPGGAPPPDGYQVDLLTESGGFDGEVIWTARRSAEQAAAMADVIRPGAGSGEFAGRSLMIKVTGGPGDQPQIAEIEVYPALRAEARRWLADGRQPRQDGPAAVQVPYGTRELSFVPEPALPANGVTGFRWKLEGWTTDWQETAPGGTVRIHPAPPPGEYRLRLEARHTDGQWDRTGTPLLLRIALPWWSHAPSVAAALSGTALLTGFLGWVGFSRRMRRRLARTEQHLELHQDRLRISRDMHDEIGARLTSIAMLAERTRRQPDTAAPILEDLAHQARTTVEALDTIVWAVNPRHDSPGGLADYLSDFVPGFLEAAGISCTLDFRLSGPDRLLPLALRHNLLMAAKEALQNVVKHAQATRCGVILEEEAGSLRLTVTDDGKGFDPETGTGITHTGLDSLRQRMKESGGICRFQPGPDGHGTRVTLEVPLPR